MQRLTNKFFQFAASIADTMLLGMLAVMFLEIFTRSVFSFSLGISDDLSAFLLVGATFLGFSVAIRSDAVFRFETLSHVLPSGFAAKLSLLLELLALATAVILAYLLIVFVLDSYRRGLVSTGQIEVPLWIPQSFMPIGMGLVVVAIVERLVTLPRN